MTRDKRFVAKLIALIIAASVLIAALTIVAVVALSVPSTPVEEHGELPQHEDRRNPCMRGMRH